jgi:hypothetical protein
MKTLRWLWPVPMIALLVLVPWTAYLVRPSHRLSVVVLDKTVPFKNRFEHRSLYWLLGYLKVVKADGTPYDLDRDYLGAFPGPVPGDPPERTRDLTAADVAGARLVYLADTYGVYRKDLDAGAEEKAALERSEKIYGGLTVAEATAVEGAASGGKILIAEFNTLGSPTDADARAILEGALGVRWTRWIGRYFTHLDDDGEVPRWMRRDYEREWGKPWTFQGPGYVLMQDDDHCEVLRVGFEADHVGLSIDAEPGSEEALGGARSGVPYPYWFDIVQDGPETHRLASFRWHLTPAGKARLVARGLPEAFPAVTRRTYPGGGAAWYFAGDFADNPMDPRPVPFAGYLGLRSVLERYKLAPSETAFYWEFYAPLMRGILSGASESTR